MVLPSDQEQAMIFLIIIIISGTTVAFGKPIASYCGDDLQLYQIGSNYRDNLLDLLRLLTAKASESGGFHKDTVGVGGPDQVNGLAMCYADASRTNCDDCLRTAANDIANLSVCEFRRTAIIHYESCFIHYSNKTFFSTMEDFKPVCLQRPGTVNFSSTSDFLSSSSVQSLIINLTTDASNIDQKYASNKTMYTGNQTVYGLVQCTMDLSWSECRKCVQSYIAYANASKLNCSDQLGARIMGPSCYIRYELYPFNITSYMSTVSVPPLLSPLPQSTSLPAAPLPAPPLPGSQNHQGAVSIAMVVVPVAACLLLLLSATLFFLWRRKGKMKNRTDTDCVSTSYLQEHADTNLELILNPSAEYQVFDLDTMRNATHNFSDKNKLGQGGFGPVYKGTLPNGQEVAVKRLSGSSMQGLRELKNEVEFLAKLKHKNLVQLLGCCIQNKEKILCYEFLPNGSLDKILFAKDPSKRLELGWKMRYKIIKGIGRGLHYLHEESRLKIIHRDLKASNVLLDKDMSPKISDFGLARFFGEDQTHIDTSVIAGTFGYMAPEYVLHGNFSTKSDVYSFGVLLLEIVTGHRNGSFGSTGLASSVTSYAWDHWKNGTISDLKDPMLEDLYLEEIIKCVHIGLLCVQEEPNIRPNMEVVNRMLASDTLPDLSTWRSPLMDNSMSDTSSMTGQSSLFSWQRSEIN